MSKKFINVPCDEDTAIIFETEAQLGERTILYQKWSWEGIHAESIIFSEDDLKGMDDNAIEREVMASPLVKQGSQITLKRNESGFTFVNFNFVHDEGDEGTWPAPPSLSPEEIRAKKASAVGAYGKTNDREIERIKAIVARRNAQ